MLKVARELENECFWWDLSCVNKAQWNADFALQMDYAMCVKSSECQK